MKVGCCHRLSNKKLLRCTGRDWHKADIPTAPVFVRYWRVTADIAKFLVRDSSVMQTNCYFGGVTFAVSIAMCQASPSRTSTQPKCPPVCLPATSPDPNKPYSP